MDIMATGKPENSLMMPSIYILSELVLLKKHCTANDTNFLP